MKKLFFSIVMMIALVIVAGSAMAQTGVTPYPGGTYTYTLGGIAIQNNGTVDLSITGGGVITAVSGLTQTANPYNIDKAVTSISFTVAYPLSETPGSKTITVTITDVTTTCFNTITKTVVVQNLPALSLSILASEANPICQAKETPGDNVAAAVTLGNTTVNTFTFTVTPIVTNIALGGTFNYEYNLPVIANGVLSGFTVSNNVTANGGIYAGGKVSYSGVTAIKTDVFTVTFKTTTGQPDQDITATIGTSKLTVLSGGGQYDGTITPTLLGTDDVNVKSMPSIGTFTWAP